MTANFDAIYNMLWDTSYNAVSQGEIEIDNLIDHPEADKRRGLTLIFRPTGAVKQSILTFLNELSRIEPDQYYYPETSLHFTVLSLFTATVEYQREYDRIQAYQSAVDRAVRGISPFLFQVKGLTVSKSAVILCGYPLPDNLNILRNALRKNLTTSGLAQGLDRRYILTAAHTTIMRFSRPLSNPAGLAEFLLENKQKTFGEFKVDGLDLVKNDWYMAQRNTTVVCRYPLNPKANSTVIKGG